MGKTHFSGIAFANPRGQFIKRRHEEYNPEKKSHSEALRLLEEIESRPAEVFTSFQEMGRALAWRETLQLKLFERKLHRK